MSLPAAAGAERTVLEPSGSWTLDFAEDKCRLVRTFGTGGDQTLLYFEQYAPSDRAIMTLAGPALNGFGRAEKVGVRFGPRDGGAYEFEVEHARFDGFGDALILPFLSPDDIAEREKDAETQPPTGYDTEGLPHIAQSTVANIEWLSLSHRNRELVLPLPQFREAMAVLNDCTLDLVRYWNLDPDSHKNMTRLAEPVNFKEIAEQVAKHYPRAALRRGEQADLNLRVIVDADGSIEECSVSAVTVAKYIKTPACDEFGSRAMFAPAEDAQGEPIRSFYNTRIIFRMGD